MRRREQREHIFKLLFISEFNTQKEMEEQLALYLADIENLEESDRDYISRKYMNIMNHTDELDEKLNSISMGWKTSRMNRVDLTVLRLAVYELEYEKEEVPVGVAINEAVELAKCFGSEESGAFVNGILGKIANPDKKVAARKASSKKEEQTSARPKSGFKVKDPSKKVVVVNRNVSSRAPENKNEYCLFCWSVDLETLQYDVLYGQRYAYGGENPFERTKMRMGLYDVTLDSIRLVSDTDWTYYIQGTNFTPSSQVKLNGEWYDTAYVSPNMLVISGTELSDFDRLAVVQRSNSSTRKALSKSFDRAVYALYDSQWKVNSR